VVVGKTITLTSTHTELERFPEFPPRDDMNNPIYLYRPSHIYTLELHVGNPETTIVLGEVPVGWTPGQSAGIRRPDLLIADNVKRALIIEQWGYAIEQQGKPPDFVLEVASTTTGENDYTAKRRDYEAYGIPEYWRFDPSGGEYHDAALAGDRLVDGAYQPIEIEWLDENRCRGYSEFLGLYVCWEYGELRWYNPETESYLRTHADEVDRAEAERVARASAEERAERAEMERDREAAAREQEAAAREQEAAARREAEAELERLRRRLEDMGDSE
jgi:hypothetical protein